MMKLIPIPRDLLSILRKEANDARHGTEVIECPDIGLAEFYEECADELERLRLEIGNLEKQLRSHGLTPLPSPPNRETE